MYSRMTVLWQQRDDDAFEMNAETRMERWRQSNEATFLSKSINDIIVLFLYFVSSYWYNEVMK